MVRAILDGRKTQTRRPIKFKSSYYSGEEQAIKALEEGLSQSEINRLCLYGKVGDRLWVRETFATDDKSNIWYKADKLDMPLAHGKWKKSINMPRWASRITLEITDIRVERNEKGVWEWVIEFKRIK